MRKTFRGTKREADHALARLVVEVEGGAQVDQSRQALAAYLKIGVSSERVPAYGLKHGTVTNLSSASTSYANRRCPPC